MEADQNNHASPISLWNILPITEKRELSIEVEYDTYRGRTGFQASFAAEALFRLLHNFGMPLLLHIANMKIKKEITIEQSN